jgi:hypothetical protein
MKNVKKNVMQGCGKRSSHVSWNFIWSIYLLLMLHTLLLKPSLKFTTLHPTTLHCTSFNLSILPYFAFHPHPTTLHYTSLPSRLAYPDLNFLPLRFTTLPHLKFLHLQTSFATLLFISLHPVNNFFPNSLSENFRFAREGT